MSIRGLRLYVTVIVLTSFVGLLSAILQASLARGGGDQYPTIYLALLVTHFLLLGSSLITFVFAPQFKDRLVGILIWLNRCGLSVLFIFGLFSITLLIHQIEEWLLPGSWLLSISWLVATLVTAVTWALFTLRQSSLIFKIDLRFQLTHQWLLKIYHRLKPTLSILVLLAFVLGVRTSVLAYHAIRMPLMCDEASTYWLFGRSLFDALIRYDAPNNHLLHSAFVFLSTSIFSNGEPAIRLPSLIAGILTIPATYILARKLFDQNVALLSAVLSSSSLWLLYYSFQARGYSSITFLSTMAIWALLVTIHDQKTRIGWVVLVSSLSLAFAILPTTLYLWVSIVCFGICIYFFQRYFGLPVNYQWLKRFLFSMGMIVAFAGFFYLNVLFFLLRTGRIYQGIFSFPLIQPQSIQDLLTSFLAYALLGGSDDIVPGMNNLPIAVTLLVAILVAISSIVKVRKWMILFLFGCLFFAPVTIILVQENLPFPRNFIYLLPPLYILIAYGLVQVLSGTLSLLSRYRIRPPRLQQGPVVFAVAVVLFTLIFGSSAMTLSRFLNQYRDNLWPADKLAYFLENTAHPEDGIVADICLEYMVTYYIDPRFHVTSVMEWWHYQKPSSHRIYVLPARGDYDPTHRSAEEFLQRSCEGRTAPKIVTQIGEQFIYQCETLTN